MQKTLSGERKQEQQRLPKSRKLNREGWIKMIVIEFSHEYCKFPIDVKYRKTVLTGVEMVMLESLDQKTRDQDTAIKGGGHYPLPSKGEYMILRLETVYDKRPVHENPQSYYPAKWQSYRRWTPAKEEYYRAHVGEEVKIKVVERVNHELGKSTTHD